MRHVYARVLKALPCGGAFILPAWRAGGVRMEKKTQLMDEAQLNRSVSRIAHEIIERNRASRAWRWWASAAGASRWRGCCKG